MKVAVCNYPGKVGKTVTAANLLAPRMNGVSVLSIETINATADSLGIDTVQYKGDKFGDVYTDIMLEDDVIVDVGSSNVEAFISKMNQYEGSQQEIDYFIIPITPGRSEQKESIRLIEALSDLGIPADRIKILFNRVEADVSEEFDIIIGYAAKLKNCQVNEEACLFESEVYGLLDDLNTTISKTLDDKTDYRAMLKSLDRKKDRRKMMHCARMIALKSLAVSARKQHDVAFLALFGADQVSSVSAVSQ